jgi:hypothetical protein
MRAASEKARLWTDVQFRFINLNLVEAKNSVSHFHFIATSAFVFLGHASV